MNNKILRTILGASLAVVMVLTMLPTTGMAASPTGHEIAPDFQNFYDQKGGLRNFGYAVSPPLIENGRLVQYFERQRFELHPEHRGTEYEVLLGLLGREIARNEGRVFQPTANPNNGAQYFNATQQYIEPRFQNYWDTRGGLRLFGYPISAPFWENGLLIQYFERARFEYHPEHAGTQYEVLLGLLGRDVWRLQNNNASLATLHPAEIVAQMVNAERTKNGIAPLRRVTAINTVASHRSNDMATRQYFSHYTPENKTVFDVIKSYGMSYVRAGETIHRNNARTTDEAAQRAFNGFMNSQQHKEILMRGDFHQFGVGYEKGSDGLHYFTIVVMTQ